jgi:hypothetical protein
MPTLGTGFAATREFFPLDVIAGRRHPDLCIIERINLRSTANVCALKGAMPAASHAGGSGLRAEGRDESSGWSTKLGTALRAY